MFNSGTTTEVFTTVQFPHTWEENTQIHPHIHIMETGATGTIRFGMEYTWANVDGVFPAPTTIYGETAADGVTGTHKMLDFGYITNTGEEISSVLHIRLFRDGTHANDTYTGDIAFMSFDIHLLHSRIGSINEFYTP